MFRVQILRAIRSLCQFESRLNGGLLTPRTRASMIPTVRRSVVAPIFFDLI